MYPFVPGKGNGAQADVLSPNESIQQAKSRRQGTPGRRSLNLDVRDGYYDTLGGVERVRRKLCWAALTGGRCSPPTEATRAAIDAMKVAHRPGSGKYEFVKSMAEPLSLLKEMLLVKTSDPSREQSSSFEGSREALLSVLELSDQERVKQVKKQWLQPSNDVDLVVQMSAKVAEIRALDALLRICRERLLTTTSRLKRLEQYWTRRVKLNQMKGSLLNRLMKDSIEGDRLRLSFAKGAYQQEIQKLGYVQRIIMSRQPGLSENELFKATQESYQRKQQEDEMERKKRIESKMTETGFYGLKWISRYSLRWNAEGRGRLTLRFYDEDVTISSDAAWDILLEGNSGDDWINASHQWTVKARKVICKILDESFAATISDTQTAEERLYAMTGWCVRDTSNRATDAANWRTILTLVDELADARRVGEGKIISITENSLRSLWNKIDVFGLPSAFAAIGLARIVHRLIPPEVVQERATTFYKVVAGIFMQRFWVPFKMIADDLLNKGPSLLDRFDTENEGKSLDIMLMNLGFGNGKEEMRKEALQRATRAYEKSLDSSLWIEVMKGNMIQLLLVQVQQLKVGLLSAMETIDKLVDANRLNVQILAAIPAVLLVTLGTRLFVRGLFSFKMKDVRSLKDVHAEMAQHLDSMERLMLLSEGETSLSTDSTPGKQRRVIVMSTSELGELVLHMHSYLVLLDYTCPPFPSRYCDAIHTSIQEILTTQQVDNNLGTERQIALVQLVKKKHMDLLKYV